MTSCGSNAILLSPPDAVPLRFGDDSFFPHLAAARGLRHRARRCCACPASRSISTTPRGSRRVSRELPSPTRARALAGRDDMLMLTAPAECAGQETSAMITWRDLGPRRGGRALSAAEALALADARDLRAADAGCGGIARRGARRSRLVFAQGLHPADAALPRRLPLLHLRASAAPRRARPISIADRCWRSPAPAPRPAATRRCSPWATSRNCATRAAREALAAARPRDDACPTSPRWRRWCCSETGLLPHLNPGVMTRADIDAAARGLGVARASCWRARAERLSQPRRAAFRLARQGAGGAPRDDRGGRRGGGAVHLAAS